MQTAIQTGCAGIRGVKFVSLQGHAYNHTGDGIHPDTEADHSVVAGFIAPLIAQAVADLLDEEG